ncbi:glycosyltransferase family 4 protein [Rhizobium sp. G21]|uniref:glycosyltransferase family 4 protein n=1 Tax=Rhizobium sp. G21 TaxID=2758439 RepID=UPI001600A071|nr:glycosyltransferase family 4 protein [Rhizobium sp. G21]MBB1250522.1 glycosyltransferase family 4 protein [Rhizobium sp. G21]
MTGDNSAGDGGAISKPAREEREGRLWFVGHLDGPPNGQIVANRLMLSLLETRASVWRLPLGASPWRKVSAALRLAATALRSSPRDRVYVSLPGQRGGWLLLAALLAFRLKRARLFLHHHSYRALRAAPTLLGHALTWAAGPRAVHILLSHAMATTFAARYLPAEAAPPLILSNAALLPAPARATRKNGPITIGLLGAWTPEKGVLQGLDLLEQLLRSDPDLHAAVAGAPSRGAETVAIAIAAAAARWPGRFTVDGWLEGEDKAAFLARLDCLLLPSRLPDEAEPLSMLEAYSAGADVLATPLGAIPERIRMADRLLTLNIEDDVDRIARAIAERRSDRRAATRACRDHALRFHYGSLSARELLLTRLTEQAIPAPNVGLAHVAPGVTP